MQGKRHTLDRQREREFYMWLDCYFSIKKRNWLVPRQERRDGRQSRTLWWQTNAEPRFPTALYFHLFEIFIFVLEFPPLSFVFKWWKMKLHSPVSNSNFKGVGESPRRLKAGLISDCSITCLHPKGVEILFAYGLFKSQKKKELSVKKGGRMVSCYKKEVSENG